MSAWKKWDHLIRENGEMRAALLLVRKYMQEEVEQIGVELLTAENRVIWDAVNGALGESTDAKK